jgi:hypothetical protein
MTSEGLDILELDECYALLRTQSLGRVAVRIAEEITILPVFYGLLGDDVVFRTGPGTKLDAAVLGTKVAFEIDCGSQGGEPGWSVLVSGHAHELREPREQSEAHAAVGDAWPAGERQRFVRITAEKVTGRRLPR